MGFEHDGQKPNESIWLWIMIVRSLENLGSGEDRQPDKTIWVLNMKLIVTRNSNVLKQIVYVIINVSGGACAVYYFFICLKLGTR